MIILAVKSLFKMFYIGGVCWPESFIEEGKDPAKE